MSKEQPQVIRRTVIPVQIVSSPHITAALNFHRPFGSPVMPAEVATHFKRVKIPYKNEADKHEDQRRSRELKYYEVSVSSPQLPDSKFSAEIPYDVKRK